MATAIQKAVSSPAGQAAVRARAGAIARKKIDEAAKAMRDKFRKAAPALRKDVIEAFAVPAVTGAVGGLALDMTLGRLPMVSGAKGDIFKGLVAIGVGTVGKKFVKSPYLHSAAVGAATINLYKLATRAINRAGDKKLSSLLAGDDDSDLAGAPGQVEVKPVVVQLNDGTIVRALQASDGTLIYDDGIAGMPEQQKTIGHVPETLNGNEQQPLVI